MRVERNISLKSYNTFGIEAFAKEFLEVADVESLQCFIRDTELSNKKLLVLGGGSNILFTSDFNGLVIKNNIQGIHAEESEDGTVLVRAGAGVVWDELVHYCMANGYGGVENLVSIPGNVGASPIQNIGAYGVELKDVFHSLEAIEIGTAEVKHFNKEECAFDYRDSVFKRHLKGKYIISSVSILLRKDHKPDVSYGAIREQLNVMGVGDPGIKDLGAAVAAIRKAKLPEPEIIGNAGSFFKNPVVPEKRFLEIRNRYPDMPSYKGNHGLVKIPAGWMIEQCGWKGRSLGNAAVHDMQALVLVNRGNATGNDVIELAQSIKNSVKEEFGIELEFEVNVL